MLLCSIALWSAVFAFIYVVLEQLNSVDAIDSGDVMFVGNKFRIQRDLTRRVVVCLVLTEHSNPICHPNCIPLSWASIYCTWQRAFGCKTENREIIWIWRALSWLLPSQLSSNILWHGKAWKHKSKIFIINDHEIIDVIELEVDDVIKRQIIPSKALCKSGMGNTGCVKNVCL